MDKPWKVIFAFVGVFVAGAIFGGVFTVGVGKKFRPEERVKRPAATAPVAKTPNATTSRKQGTDAKPAQAKTGVIQPTIMRQLTQRLGLTSEQKERVRPIVTRAAEDMARLGREHLADTARVMDRMNEDISALLTPEQRLQLENMKQERLERVRLARQKLGGTVSEATPEGANRAGSISRPTSTSSKTKTP
jgi:Spy/CpxP family protein refolding chaperone